MLDRSHVGDVARPREAGHTLIEVSIASVLLVALLVMTHGSMSAVNTASQLEAGRLRSESTLRTVLRTIGEDLQSCTTESDALTGVFRYDTTPMDGFGYQMLEGITTDGSQMLPLWSSTVRIRVTEDGRVLRIHNGETRVLGTGVRSVRLSVDVANGGLFRIDCTTVARDLRTGEQRTLDGTHWVRPIN